MLFFGVKNKNYLNNPNEYLLNIKKLKHVSSWDRLILM